MVTRSFTLPLLAVVAASLVRVGVAGDGLTDVQDSITKGIGPEKARLAFVHAIAGADKVDLLADGKTVRRNIRYGSKHKAESINGEGYSIDVNAAKVGLPYINGFVADLIGGHDYTLVAFGDIDGTTPSAALLIDLPGSLIPKETAKVLFTNATVDAASAELLIDGQSLFSAVGPGQFQGTTDINAGKHQADVRINGQNVLETKVHKIKGGRTINFVLYGTALEGDGSSLKLLESEVTSR